MPEWSIGHAWKACVLSKAPRVRIPLCPPARAAGKDSKDQAKPNPDGLSSAKENPSLSAILRRLSGEECPRELNEGRTG